MNAPLRETNVPGFSLPLTTIAACLDCMRAFDLANDSSCPTCGTSIGIVTLRVTGKNVVEKKEAEL